MIQKLTNKLTNRKKDNKGFTLVELIVVIVILAILAAILVPALTGWIDKAKESQYTVEARNVYLATQALISEEYGKSTTPPAFNITWANGKMAEIRSLADVGDTVTVTALTVDSDNKITAMEITFDTIKMSLSNGSWVKGTVPATP